MKIRLSQVLAQNFAKIASLPAGLMALSSVSCGSGAPRIPDELLVCENCETEDYPSGPYGTEIGSTVTPLTFSGYRNPEESRTEEEIGFADFYDPEGEKGVKLLLINTAAAWCQPCLIEHGDLPDRVRELSPLGLHVLSALFQDAAGEPASFQTLDTWTRNFETNFPMVVDPGYQMGLYGPAETPPLNLIVDPIDMTLLARFVGNQEGPMWEFIERELAARN